MEQKDLFTPHAAHAARDEALARVLENAGKGWLAAALEALYRFLRDHEEFIGEEFRVWASQDGLPPPHHHNAWGALFGQASRRGMIRMSGRLRPMQTARSHARRSPVWDRISPSS